MYLSPDQKLQQELPKLPVIPPSAGGAGDAYPGEFIAHFERAMQASHDESACGTLLLVSIDNMAMILSAYGHEAAESVMKALAQHTADMLGPNDRIERLQRDQFGVILANSHPEDSEHMAQRIAGMIQNYGRDKFSTAALHVLGTIGAVHFPSEATAVNDALDKAFIALHSTQGGAYRTYTSRRGESDLLRQQMGLASYLYGAFRDRRLRLAWQPVVETQTGRVTHYEALLRMVGYGNKITSAGALIPVAEKMGLIDSIDRMVLEMVVAELRACPDVRLALNVSNLTTDNQGWLDYLQSLVGDSPDVASRLMVEITETAAQRDLRRVAYFVAATQALGCQVALDDFGSGYTSFRQLKALSVDMVKIDGVFIRDLPHSADNRFFVKTLLEFIRGFGLQSVAEFVENGEIAKILMELGVDYMQGYYFGKPENHRRWLADGEYKKD